jgi:hypothetical protein
MDKLARQLKEDAARIDVRVSDELDRRISASLESVTPERPAAAEIRQRPGIFRWASSLTGVTAALAIIAVLNWLSPAVAPGPQVAEMSPVIEVVTPVIDWKTESAMLTRPLRQELEDLRSDIKKAEEKVKQDIGL